MATSHTPSDPGQTLSLQAPYLRQIADQLRTMGADVPAWLTRHGLNEARLNDGTIDMPMAQFQALVMDGIEVTGEPAMGLLVGERLLVNSHGMLGFAAAASHTIRVAVQLFETYVHLRTSMISVQLLEVGEGDAAEAHIRILESQPLGEARRPVLEAVVLTIRNVLDFITRGNGAVRYVAFPFARPDYAALAQDLFRCEVRYRQGWAGFALPASQLDVPLAMADPAAFQQALQVCQRELDKLQRSETFSDRVRRVLLEKRQGFPSLQVVARLFNMTPRTLHRRLQDEGTTFQQLLEGVRHQLAIGHLTAGQLSVQEIAWLLGYTEVANFRRAFKRWEGVAPSAWQPPQATG